MNPSQSKTTRYIVAALCGLALLLVIGWLALRESPPPSPDLPPVRAVTVSPSVPDNAAAQDTSTNPAAESAAIPTNAATIYRQAFAVFDALSQDQKNLLKNWRTNVDAAVTAELCEKIQPICNLMHQAAAAPNCDWGLSTPVIYETLLPDLNHSRNMARVAIWSVAHCRRDDTPAAVDDLVAASRLGQNVSPPTLVGHLVDLAIQAMVIDTVAEHASTLVSAGDARLVEQLNDRDYNQGLRGAFELEADMGAKETDRLAALPPDEMKGQLKEIESLAKDPSQFESLKPAQIIADLRQAAELRSQYAQALGLPDADYRAWLASLDEAGKTNPFIEVYVASFEQAVIKTQTMTVMSAMAGAGLAVMQAGPDALQSHPDPTTGQPFAYTQTADSFALESSFPFLGKPMKLSFK
jgi:hypothetical protein